MNRASRLVLPMFIAAVVGGCSTAASPTNPTPGLTLSDLVGSWRATSAIHTNQANTTQMFDLIAAGGETRFTMLAGGGTRTWVELGSFSDEWDSVVSLNGSTATSVPVEAGRPTVAWTVALVGGVLTLTTTDTTFDFTQTGAPPVSTTQVLVLVRSN